MLSLPYKILLGSKSPRRREILTMAGFEYENVDIFYDEDIKQAGDLASHSIPEFLANQKALHYRWLKDDELLITADTLVFLDDQIIGKPIDKEDAFNIIQQLAGKKHTVITGVCILSKSFQVSFSRSTDVYFKVLDLQEVEYYLGNYNVLDKAGAYGVQDWIGLIGIERIEGSFYNVMGLPIDELYAQLKKIAEESKELK